MNLLIVNDEKGTTDTMKREIEWSKYGITNVYTAYNTEEGKLCIEDNLIDILLCDIEMPGENGLALLRWVRENKKDIECIFLTCHAKFDYAQEAISLGCQDYILIPAKYENIAKTVEKVVQRVQKQRDEARYQEYGKYMLQEKMRQEEKVETGKVTEAVSAYILKNIENPGLTVDKLAEYFHFHPVYLNRIFKKEKGESVSQYIINERMKLAALLLDAKQYGANEVAEKVGYSHYTNFYNMFKKYYGCSPAKYMEKTTKV